MKTAFLIFIWAFFACALSACAPKGRDLTTDSGSIAEGERLMNDDFFDEARKQFFRIKIEFPQSSMQVIADLKIAESYYKEENYASAATAYEEFIKTYPGRPEVVDALYQLGMSYLMQMPDTPQRDTRATRKVVDTFTRLMIDYPQNKYAKDAQANIERARNQLASKIFEVARFYEVQGSYDSAARRYAEVVDQYSDLPLAEEAWARETKSLRAAGKKEKAEELAKGFLEKYPKSGFLSLVK